MVFVEQESEEFLQLQSAIVLDVNLYWEQFSTIEKPFEIKLQQFEQIDSHDDSSHDDLSHDDSSHDDSADDDSTYDDSAHDDSSQNDSSNDDSADEGSADYDSAVDDSAHDDSSNNESADDDSVVDDSSHDDSHNDSFNKTQSSNSTEIVRKKRSNENSTCPDDAVATKLVIFFDMDKIDNDSVMDSVKSLLVTM